MDTAGLLLRVAGVIEDVTDRKRALEALHDGRQRLDSFVMTARDAIVTLDENLRVVLSNPAARACSATPPPGCVGCGYTCFYRSRSRHPLRSTLRIPATRLRRTAVKRISHCHGSAQGRGEVSERSFARHVYANGRRYFTATLRDLTERRQASDLLRESQRRLSDLLSNAEMVAVIIDRTATIDYCNDYFLRLTGWERREVLGKSFFDLFVPADCVTKMRGVYAAMLANLPSARHHESTILTRVVSNGSSAGAIPCCALAGAT